MKLYKAIIQLEKIARTVQGIIAAAPKSDVRNRAAMQLARIDQMIADRKARAGLPGCAFCAYLNN